MSTMLMDPGFQQQQQHQQHQQHVVQEHQRLNSDKPAYLGPGDHLKLCPDVHVVTDDGVFFDCSRAVLSILSPMIKEILLTQENVQEDQNCWYVRAKTVWLFFGSIQFQRI